MASKTIKHSPRFALVAGYYPRLWNLARVKKAVECGWITADEYAEITGEEYAAE